jgi:phosphatidylglycerol:prolipoprotein diacylglycerol transferase
MSVFAQDGLVVVTVWFDPVIARLGPLQLGWHGLLTALAVAVAIWLALRLAAQQGLPVERVGDVAIWGVAGGVVGARLFHVLDHLDYYAQHPLQAVAVWEGGIAVYGGFIGGIAAGWIAAARFGLPTWRLLDLAAPAMLVGQAIGRLGCLSNGDAWGAPCAGGPAVCLAYVNPDDLLPDDLRGVPTHPYPGYEILAEIVLLALLWRLRGRLRAPGQQFLFAALGYAAIRFALTAFRQETIVVAGLQEAQVVALATAAAALIAYGWDRVRAPAPSG